MKVWKVPLGDGMTSGTAINSKGLDRQPFMLYNIQNRGWIIIDKSKSIPTMFTQEQKDHIQEVKKKIQMHIVEVWMYDVKYTRALRLDKINLSGGAIASLLQGQEPKDWDFYFEDQSSCETFEQAILSNVDKVEVADVNPKYGDYIGKDGKMITANSITMKDGNSFITKFYGEIDDIKKEFDFVHCMPHYSLKEEKLYISYNQYDACVNKKLIVNNPKKVKSHRIIKFKERGYHRV